jgi:hypothetical protein
MFFNQSAALLGNFVGGAIVMGTSEHVMNHWNSPIPFEHGHAAGTLTAGDVESTRKAKEDRPPEEKQLMRDRVRARSRSRSMATVTQNNTELRIKHASTIA